LALPSLRRSTRTFDRRATLTYNRRVPQTQRVSAPPDRAALVFDGDCGFCRFWIARWRYRTGDAVEYVPFQDPDIPRRFPEIPRERFAHAVQLIEPDGRVSEAAEAVARLFALARRPALLWAYEHVPGVPTVTERAYRAVADHRSFASAATRLLWGRAPEPSTYARATWLFLRLLGIVYLFAFWSLAGQILGLAGHDGILPIGGYLASARTLPVPDRFWLLPTLAWVSASDAWLRAMCFGGMALSGLLVAGILPAVVLPLLWVTYLSLSVVGQDFLSFQWDALLLEAGVLAIFLAPFTTRERLRDLADPPRVAVWLFLWLLFRLTVGSGVVKLMSGDPTWHNLTALAFHFETQPIPTPLAWYVHQLPAWLLKGATAGVLAIEIGVPFLIVAPRRMRVLAFVLLEGLQVLIALTGNYAFFNLLTVALGLFLLDDAAFGKWGHVRGDGRWMVGDGDAGTRRTGPQRIRRALLIAVAVVTVPVSAVAFAGALRIELPGAALVDPLVNLTEPFRSVNQYGLFAVMTVTRPEIVIEGSADGSTWAEYEFRYKAGDVHRRPPWVAPFQPRLDWQMWFAALSRFDDERWFQNFCVRLLQGDDAVLRLLERDPFQGRKPRYVRAVLYRYQFSDAEARRRDGVWWTRERLGEYSPVLSLSVAGPAN
jgi:predicted DCC family thiol-disulfide oxidoreductase YuxK